MKRVMYGLLLTGLFTIVFAARAATEEKTVEGRMEGLNCLLHEKVCPVDHLDPHVAFESDFVLFMEKKDDYLLIPNIPKIVKARHIGKKIRIRGTINTKYKTIIATDLKVKKEGAFRMVWSRDAQMDEWEKWRKGFYEGSESAP